MRQNLRFGHLPLLKSSNDHAICERFTTWSDAKTSSKIQSVDFLPWIFWYSEGFLECGCLMFLRHLLWCWYPATYCGICQKSGPKPRFYSTKYFPYAWTILKTLAFTWPIRSLYLVPHGFSHAQGAYRHTYFVIFVRNRHPQTSYVIFFYIYIYMYHPHLIHPVRQKGCCHSYYT